MKCWFSFVILLLLFTNNENRITVPTLRDSKRRRFDISDTTTVKMQTTQATVMVPFNVFSILWPDIQSKVLGSLSYLIFVTIDL